MCAAKVSSSGDCRSSSGSPGVAGNLDVIADAFMLSLQPWSIVDDNLTQIERE